MVIPARLEEPRNCTPENLESPGLVFRTIPE
ncbi:hypothetical protein FBZ94_101216 [Bradyrhizobium sacchari]|uniref:Uncharacterized protein n=1 Tax=Bradyrhizobium sacchari TaxID=1399419 RepID=A0A560KKY6_9BRAD|nr:hypothetical protein FBZ94_101216 [Bradyrhizobium sacchari]TWB83779.1 hypothetical protein FBZ95_101215 [Bradyrhizobium sacchari]